MQSTRIAGTGFGAAAFVNNAPDELYRIGVIGIYNEAGYISSTVGEPRTWCRAQLSLLM